MEAMAISLVLNNESLPRPLTHDLFLMTLKAFKAELRRVEINDLREGTFYAVLVLSGPEGRTRVDCRPSDAIALAMRAGAPILVGGGSTAAFCRGAAAGRTKHCRGSYHADS